MSLLRVSVPDRTIRRALSGAADDVEILEWDLVSPPPRDEFDMVVTPFSPAPEHFRAVAGVRTRLVQIPSIGFDTAPGNLPPGNVAANAATVHETATAEGTLALLVAAVRDIPRWVRQQEAGEWKPFHSPGLADSRVLLIGWGGVGQAIAARLDPFEVSLTRVAHHARNDERGHVYATDELPDLLPHHDVVIVVVPLTEATEHLVDHAFLAAMPDGATLVNVARGRVADTEALVRHGERLVIALDVTDPEPLPAGHPLWEAARVISPHVAGVANAMNPRLAALLLRQVGHLQAGEEPENVVLRT